MQISKFLPAICAIAFCASFVSVRADEDNPAQAAARAALMEKMNGTEAPAAEAPPAPSAPAATVPAVTNAEPNQTMPPAAAAPAPEPVQPSAPMMDNPPAPTVPAPVRVEPAPAVPAADSDADTEAQAAARAALMQKMSVLDSQQPAPVANPAAAPVAAKPVDVDSSAVVFRPIEAPALPISMGKEAQLQALLARYKADLITPEQYHKQRAAILAQP